MPTAQGRVGSAALLPHGPGTGELTPPPCLLRERTRWASVVLSPGLVWSWDTGQPAGAAGSPHALPCSLLWRCRARSEPTKPTGWFLRLCPACLVGFLTIHTCRGQFLTAGQTLHLTDALSNYQPFFLWPVRAPLPSWCSLFLCRAVRPWNGTRLHRDLLPENNIFLFSNKKLKKFTSLV